MAYQVSLWNSATSSTLPRRSSTSLDSTSKGSYAPTSVVKAIGRPLYIIYNDRSANTYGRNKFGQLGD